MARYATVSSITFQGIEHEGRDKALERGLSLIDQAAWDKPDLMVLPEVFRDLCIDMKTIAETAEPLDGPTVTALAERARKYNCYIVCPFCEKAADGIYNSAALIDRKGKVAGVYRKYYPTIGELELGIRPGAELPVFQTDFGRLGIAICFDLNFHEVMTGLKANGAEIIAFCSMYRGGLQLLDWAFGLRRFIISATPSEHSRIVDPLGRVLADSSFYELVISRRINLDCAVIHIDYNFDCVAQAKKELGTSLELIVGSPEARYFLINHDPKTKIDEILRRFKCEPEDVYFKRARAAREEYLVKNLRK